MSHTPIDPETRRYLRQNLHLVHDADLRAEVQDLPEGDNFQAADAARIARLCADMGQIGDAESRSASRALGWWVVAVFVALLVAAFFIGFGMVKFGAYVGAKTEATVAMAAERGAW
jgi:hypothetical protein